VERLVRLVIGAQHGFVDACVAFGGFALAFYEQAPSRLHLRQVWVQEGKLIFV
jgi:hypothetical protein